MKEENYKSAYWQNLHWRKQLKEMIRNPAAVNEIGFSNFPKIAVSKIKSLSYKYVGINKDIHKRSLIY